MSLADDPTALAVLEAIPYYPVPPTGTSPAIDALRAAPTGHGIAVGRDGVMMIVRRPWLELDCPVTGPIAGYLPYGSIGEKRAFLRCGPIPKELLTPVLAHFRESLPNEAGAFIVWHEPTKKFDVRITTVMTATPSRLVYDTPILGRGWHIVCDIHSHGTAPAFFSATDDRDDDHSTKISVVFGNIDDRGAGSMAMRLCAGGMFIELPRSPFTGNDHAA